MKEFLGGSTTDECHHEEYIPNITGNQAGDTTVYFLSVKWQSIPIDSIIIDIIYKNNRTMTLSYQWGT